MIIGKFVIHKFDARTLTCVVEKWGGVNRKEVGAFQLLVVL